MTHAHATSLPTHRHTITGANQQVGDEQHMH